MRDDRRPRELRELLEQKYRRCQRFREKLKATGEANILHSVKDLKWDIGLHTTDICHPHDPKSTKGQNLFGTLLMVTRSKLANLKTAPEAPPLNEPRPNVPPQSTRNVQVHLVGEQYHRWYRSSTTFH
jgi:hypothetical protein